MLDWYLELSISTRLCLFFLAGCYCFVMVMCFRSLTRSRYPVGWHRGIQSTPIFMILMWIGTMPLVIPAVIIYFRRSSNLSSAPFIGNLNSRIYHLRNCEYQRQIASNFHRHPFFSEKEAKDSGFRPCNWCCGSGRY